MATNDTKTQLDPEAQAIIDAITGGANERKPIGVDPGYTVKKTVPTLNPSLLQFGVDKAKTTVEASVGPKYFSGDELYPAAQSPADVLKLQLRLKDSGLYPKNYVPRGVWDQTSQDAMGRIMSYANQAGVDKEEIIKRWTQYAPAEDEKNVSSYVLTLKNPEDIKGVLQEAAGKVIGRSLTPTELDNMRAQYSNLDRMAQEQQAAAKQIADMTTDGTNQPVYESPSVDQFAENQLRSKYKGEADWVQANSRMHEFYSILGEGSAMSAGGR